MLEVTLYSYDPTSEPSFSPGEPIKVPYVSYVNGGTHGAPALVAPTTRAGERIPTLAEVGDTVLYINTSVVPTWTIKRVADGR